MSKNQTKTKIKAALEYAIFSKRPIYLSYGGSQAGSLELLVESYVDGNIVCRAHTNINYDYHSSKSNPLQVSLNYRHRRLLFPATVADINQQDSTITLSVPTHGELDSNRSHLRAILKKQYSAKLFLARGSLNIPIDNVAPIDISLRAIKFEIPRASGLALEGDVVVKITIHDSSSLLLDGSGHVTRVSPLKSGKENRSYSAVVMLSNVTKLDSPVNEEQRKTERVTLEKENGAFVRFGHPLFENQEMVGSVNDISTSGISFQVKSNNFPILPGMYLSEAHLHLPLSSPTRIRLRVMNVQSINGSELTFRVGTRFISTDLVLLKKINELIQKSISDNLCDASPEHTEELWALFFDSGFIYEDKRKYLQNRSSSILSTIDKILKSNTPILKKVLYRDSDRLVGHVSAVKYFDQTWMVQHLNAIKTDESPAAAKTVLKAITQFFMGAEGNKLADNNYAIFYYQPSNLYPSLVFGEAKKYIDDPSICGTQDLSYCLIDKSKLYATVDNDRFIVREAEEEDLFELESTLIKAGNSQLIRLEGLSRDGIVDIKVVKEYEKCGLYRRRRVFVSEDRKSNSMAFAVCNYASPGLNLSELTNSFRIFYSSNDFSTNTLLAQKLMPLVIDSYSHTEMDTPVLLADESDPIPLPFVAKKVYRYWYLDTSHTVKFRESTNFVFRNFKQILARHLKALKHEKDLKA